MTSETTTNSTKPTRPPDNSPPWSREIKLMVTVGAVIFFIFLVWRFQSLASPIILGLILAYLTNPLINALEKGTRLSRGPATGIVYLTAIFLLLTGLTLLGFAAYTQILNFLDWIPDFIEGVPQLMIDFREAVTQPFVLFGYTFQLPWPTDDAPLDWQAIARNIANYAEPVFSTTLSGLGNFTLLLVNWGTTFLLAIFIALYTSFDAPRIGGLVSHAAAPPGYQEDAEKLFSRTSIIWSKYLRGQALLGVAIGFITGSAMWVLGVENAIALGVIAGFLELIPTLGPILSTIINVSVVLFQQTPNTFDLSTWQLALAVLGVMVLIQQAENNIFVPRILGQVLDLHPLVILVGVIMFTIVGGLLGAIVAAPILATLKLFGRYAWRKLFDLHPFEDDDEEAYKQPNMLEQLWERWQMRRARAKMPVAEKKATSGKKE